MAFQLPPLPYDFNALEPYIDARTMEIHHDRHHAAYVTNLNAAIEKYPELANRTLEELITNLDAIPEDIRTAVRNNGGGHWNHTMFWEIMGPRAGGEPEGDLAYAIRDAFGSFAEFKNLVNQAGLARFGSGWAWLTMEPSGALRIESTPNQDVPLMEGRIPILGVDVWEHAYYLLYQNRRGDYLNAWWNTVNWAAVSERYKKAKQR
ncbi:MAG: superoxide dismutase [Chloroflexota bacterium]|nr:superoxide dismutase [Dehalococcoidia bacterium]MDW8255166.1 superoxide dismutase [Chloroflexota bacterium]